MNERTPKKITAAVLAAVLAVGSVPATTLATTVAAFAADTTTTEAAVLSEVSGGIETNSLEDGNHSPVTSVIVAGETSLTYQNIYGGVANSGNKIKVKFDEKLTKEALETYAAKTDSKPIGTGGSPNKVPFFVKFKVDGVTDVEKINFTGGYDWDDGTNKALNFDDGTFQLWFPAEDRNEIWSKTNGEHTVKFTYGEGTNVKEYSVVIVNDIYDAATPVNVNFTKPANADLTVTKDGETLSSGATVEPFDELTVTLKPTTGKENYRVADANKAVLVDGKPLTGAAVADGTGIYTGTYVVPESSKGVAFVFADLIQTANVTANSVASGNGTLNVVDGNGEALTADTAKTLDVGTTITITPTANAGYALDKVTLKNATDERKLTDNGDGTYSYTITKDDTALIVEATFKKQIGISYTTVIANGRLNVYKYDDKTGRGERVNPTGATVDPGQKLEVVVTPNDPTTYKITAVKSTVNGADADVPTDANTGAYIYTVTAGQTDDVAFSATIEAKKEATLGDITVDNAANGTITVTKDGTAVAKGEKLLEDDVLTITVAPAQRKKVSTITVGGTAATKATDENDKEIDNTYTYTVKGTDEGNTLDVIANFKSIGAHVLTFTNPTNGTMTVTNQKGVSKGNGDLVDEGDVLTINVTPIGDYKVSQVTNNSAPITPTDGKYTVTVSAADVVLNATLVELAKPAVKITQKNDGKITVMNGTTEVADNTTVKEGDKLTITAVPVDDNHTVTAIRVNNIEVVADKDGVYTYEVKAGDTTTLTVTADYATQATITIDSAINDMVEVKKASDGSVVKSGDKVAAGDTLTVNVKAGYTLTDPTFALTPFTGTAGSTVSGTSYTVKATDKSITINGTATEKDSTDKAKANLQLTVRKGALKVTKGDTELYDGDEVIEGDVLKFTVTPGTGSDIRKIIVGGTELKLKDYTAEYTVPADASSTLTVNAECKTKIDVTVGNLTNGSVVVKNEDGEKVTTAIENDVLTLEVTPDAGYKITDNSVKVNNGSPITAVSEKYTYTVQNADTKVEVTATFALKGDGEKAEATVKFAEAKNGTFTVKNSNANVKDGDKVKEADGLTIVPAAAEGFKVAAVKVNDTVIEADKDGHFVYTVLAADKDKELTISVEFEAIITAKLAETKNGTFTVKNGETEVKDGDEIKAGDKLAIEAAPDEGYGVASVKVNGTAVEAVEGKYTYEVKADDKTVEIAVEFEVLAPAAVTELKNTARTYNSLTFTWKASEKADSYAVSYKTGNDDWSAAKTVTETTAKLDGLKSNAKYTVRVVALKGTAASEEATAEAETKASAKMTVETPTNGKVSIVRQDGKVLNSGAAITEGIKITIKPTANANYQIDKVMANGKEVTADANGAYVYTVEKVNEFTVSATFKVSAPAAVTGIKATKTGYNSATVTWNKSAVATKYEVSYKTASGSWSTAKTVTTNSAALTGLTANTAYTVRVVAVNGAGKSAAATGTVTTKASPKITFTAPKNGKYTVTRDVDKKVLKSGCNVTEGLGLTIKPTANSGYKVGVVKANGVTLKANANGEYKFNVPKSNAFSISVTFTAVAPAKATGIKVTKSGYNALTVGWNKVANATKYEVSFKTATGSWSKTQTVTGTSAKLSGLTANTKYTVRVIAVNGTVKGAAATANVTTLASPAVKLTTPKNGKVVMTYPNGKTLKSGAHITQGLVLNIKPTANKGYKVAKVVVNGTEVKANAKGQYRYTVGRTNALTVTVTFSK